MSSPEQTYLALIASGGRTTSETATAIYNIRPARARPLASRLKSFLLGEWAGADFDTGRVLAEMKWAGKAFRSEEDVDPVVVYDSDEGGTRKRVWLESFGRARIREVRFRGYFRYVDEDTVASMMDAKGLPGGYHFHLKRYKN